MMDENIKIQLISKFADGQSMWSLRKEFGMSEWGIRKVVDPVGFEKARLDRIAKGRSRPSGSRGGNPHPWDCHPIYDPNRDGLLFHETFSAWALGDPLPGRSALDQRRKND